MIDVEHERLLTFNEARRHPALRSRDKHGKLKPGSLAKVYRLADRGIRGNVLESVSLPSGRATSIEAVNRFIAKLTGSTASTSAPATPSQRRRELRRADAVLERAGI